MKYILFQMNDILNKINNVNNIADKIKLEKKLDLNESTDLKPNGLGRKYFYNFF